MEIYISADFLMTKESEQNNNIKWIFDFLSFPIRKATGIQPKKFEPSFIDKNKFNREAFFLKSGIQLNKYQQHFYFSIDQISKESISYLQSHLDGCLVIGYELSQQTKQILENLNITYIDIWLHPARFLDDVYFAFRSNSRKINNALQEAETNEELLFAHANRLKVQSYKGFKTSKKSIKENTAVFIGQTLNDKAVCNNGLMLNVLNFKEDFHSLAKKYKNVVYSRHPFVKEGDESILAFVKSFRNVELSPVPSYELLCSESVEEIVTISSSVATEAIYFSKRSNYLYRPPIYIYNPDHGHFTIGQEWVFSWFWSKILSGTLVTNEIPKTQFESQKDKFRDALSFYWGYRNIDKLESFKQTFSNLIKQTEK